MFQSVFIVPSLLFCLIQRYCLWVKSSFSLGHCMNQTLPNLKYSQVCLVLFWKNGAIRGAQLHNAMMHLAGTSQACFYLFYTPVSSFKKTASSKVL